MESEDIAAYGGLIWVKRSCGVSRKVVILKTETVEIEHIFAPTVRERTLFRLYLIGQER